MVGDAGVREHHGDGEGEAVPVEEAGDVTMTIGDAQGELVGPEGQVARLNATSAYDQEEKDTRSATRWEMVGPSH